TKRTTFSSAMVSAIEPIAVVMKPAARNGLSTYSSVTSPTIAAAMKAKASEGTIGNPRFTFPISPAKAPIVACHARPKFRNPSTAKTAVNPMAGTARMVPAIRPLMISWRTSVTTAISGDLEKLELGPGNFLVPELAVDDVADVGEVARAARALVIDLLAF